MQMLRELDLGEFEFGGINITGIQPISAALNETDSTSKLNVCSLRLISYYREHTFIAS